MLGLRDRLTLYTLDTIMATLCVRYRAPLPEQIAELVPEWPPRLILEIAMAGDGPIGDPPYVMWVCPDDLETIIVGAEYARRIGDNCVIASKPFRRLDPAYLQELRQTWAGRGGEECVMEFAQMLKEYGEPQ